MKRKSAAFHHYDPTTKKGEEWKWKEKKLEFCAFWRMSCDWQVVQAMYNAKERRPHTHVDKR